MALAAVLFGVLAAVPACSHPKQGSALPPAQSTPASTSASPSQSASVNLTDVQQLEALGRLYYVEYTRAVNSGDTSRVASLVTATCNCVKPIQSIANAWSGGGRIVAPDLYVIHKVGPTKLLTRTTGFTNVFYAGGKETDYNREGKVVATYPPLSKEQADSLQFIKIKGVWKIDEVDSND